jgi:hypothetical protein
VSKPGPRFNAPASSGDEPPRCPEWDGRPLVVEGEVALVVLGAVTPPGGGFPMPGIAAARGGEATRLVRPWQLAAFLGTHAGVSLVCERAGLLHGMLEDHLRKFGAWQTIEDLWRFSRDGRLLDVILLDQLVDMAEKGVEKKASPLDAIVKSRCAREVPRVKDLESRIPAPDGRSRAALDPTLEREIASIVEALLDVYRSLRPRADRFTRWRGAEATADDDHAGMDREEGVGSQHAGMLRAQEIGPLSLGIQVKGAIALERLTRSQGLKVEAASDLVERCEQVHRECSQWLLEGRTSKKCFKWSGGEVSLDKTKGFPEECNDHLDNWLKECVNGFQGSDGLPFRPPWSKERVVSRSSNFWCELATYHPGLARWERLWTAATSRIALIEARGKNSPLLRPEYQSLPRIRSTFPNVELLRSLAPGTCFTAPPGQSLLVGEIRDLELRYLASGTALNLGLGKRLSDLFEGGIDPVRYAAAAIHGQDEVRTNRPYLEKFDALERDDPQAFNAWMTIARTVLHLAPRGLSGESISRQIRERLGEATYGIDDEVISKSCNFILGKVFQGLDGFSSSWTTRIVREALGIGYHEFLEFRARGAGFDHHLRSVIEGLETDPELLSRLREVCQNEEMKRRLTHGSPDLYDAIFGFRSATGRGRGMLEYRQRWAAQFLDSVEDLRKRVYYELAASDFDLAAISGDEFVLLYPGRHVVKLARRQIVAHAAKELVEGVLREHLRFVRIECRMDFPPAW